MTWRIREKDEFNFDLLDENGGFLGSMTERCDAVLSSKAPEMLELLKESIDHLPYGRLKNRVEKVILQIENE